MKRDFEKKDEIPERASHGSGTNRESELPIEQSRTNARKPPTRSVRE